MVEITSATLADGREILYFDDQPHPDRVLVDARDIPTVCLLYTSPSPRDS